MKLPKKIIETLKFHKRLKMVLNYIMQKYDILKTANESLTYRLNNVLNENVILKKRIAEMQEQNEFLTNNLINFIDKFKQNLK